MAMGDQAPSEPMPLREDELAAARGIFGWSLAMLCVIAVVALVARVMQ